MPSHFSAELFSFLRSLERNNNREWFQKNNGRYESAIKQPALKFIADFTPHLEALSPHFLAEPKAVGGSLFRIHRDTRFAKDKRPYKTQVGIQFRHRKGKDAHAPGFYLHLSPKECFVGVGLWRPETKLAGAIREAIAADPEGWKRAAHGKAFARRFRLSGESLKRPPRGFDAEHPLVDDLKRKDFIAVADLDPTDATKAGFIGRFAKLCQTGGPYMAFLCDACGLDY